MAALSIPRTRSIPSWRGVNEAYPAKCGKKILIATLILDPLPYGDRREDPDGFIKSARAYGLHRIVLQCLEKVEWPSKPVELTCRTNGAAGAGAAAERNTGFVATLIIGWGGNVSAATAWKAQAIGSWALGWLCWAGNGLRRLTHTTYAVDAFPYVRESLKTYR